MKIEIDQSSGFCFGVVTAIRKAEEVLDASGSLFCLGDIVHNAKEVERLENKGLSTINHADLENLHNVKVLLRAHGEPPATYKTATENGVEIVDATCPVVLQLQRRIKAAYDAGQEAVKKGGEAPQIVIYGKPGHAEVNGLVGQTNGEAIVIQSIDQLDEIPEDRDILLYSQTTKSPDGFREIVEALQNRCRNRKFEYFDTICRQVSRRMQSMMEFARSHDAVLFVSGTKSSNGKALYERCLSVNPRTYLVSDPSEVNIKLFKDSDSIGITGATSTPRWLMEQVRDKFKTIQ